MMDLPIDIPEKSEKMAAAAAASKAWKKNKWKAFRMGLILAFLVAAIAAIVFAGSHYMKTSSMEDLDGLEQQLEEMCEADIINIQNVVQKGDYLAVSSCDNAGLWYLGIYNRDDVFSERWKISGSLSKVKPGNLANWNYETPEGDTILVSFGAELSDNICGYTFTNNGVTYTCPVAENAVLDFFFIPDAYDPNTHLEPIY